MSLEVRQDLLPQSREGNGTPLQYSCPENPMDRGAWWAAVHGIAKSRARLSDFTFTFHIHALEKEMATHCSVLAWRLPGTEEPSGLLSMGSHRVRHNWSNLAAAAACLNPPCRFVLAKPPPTRPLSVFIQILVSCILWLRRLTGTWSGVKRLKWVARAFIFLFFSYSFLWLSWEILVREHQTLSEVSESNHPSTITQESCSLKSWLTQHHLVHSTLEVLYSL